ncbi:MAG: polysaccharide biosynthesis protein [Clostridia bacterium]|nr:polysaccharide biosynthesis protein [Clostridia bacterium]
MKAVFGTMRNRQIFALDIVLIFLAYMVSIFLIFPAAMFQKYLFDWLLNLFATELVYLIVYFAFGVYRVHWGYATSKEYSRLLSAALLSTVIAFALNALLTTVSVNPKFNLFFNVAIIGMTTVCRFLVKIAHKRRKLTETKHGKRVLIIGAGQLAANLLHDIHNDARLKYSVVGLIDDDKTKHNQIVCGAMVLGTREDIIRVCRLKDVEEIIFSIYEIDAKEKQKILSICTETGCSIKIMSGIDAVLSGNGGVDGVRNIGVEDLLEREPIHLDNEAISEEIKGKTVLVTGGGGSIGSELCRQIAQYNPGQLVIVDVYENSAYDLENELRDKYRNLNLTVLIASIRDEKRLDDIFKEIRPELIFHAAAHKHVPLMEHSPTEAVKNNVFGTYNVVKCADKYGVKRFVMISTDKAVNPTNVMGATKRVCEMIVQTMARNSKTDFVAVRFGNVLGSNGSVIPRFKKQIEAGGPVTVTHPEITRFFMTIPEAAHLVLQAASYAEGGEIFVLDMGQPVKIYELAKKMILLAGYEPEKDIKIEFTGLRPGEKLYEELLMNEEGLKETKHNKIFIGKPMNMTEEELNGKLAILKEALPKGNDAVKAALREVVPTYVPPKEQ